MKKNPPLSVLVFLLIFALALGLAFIVRGETIGLRSLGVVIAGSIVALFVSSAIKVADQWEKVLVLRLGKLHAPNGPGLFFIIPIIDSVPYWVDTRVITDSFKAEKTLFTLSRGRSDRELDLAH